MKSRLAFTVMMLSLLLFAGTSAFAQDEAGKRVAPAVATILVRNSVGQFEVVGSGIFVRNDGVLLTAYNLIQGAREIQVRLSNGETYDKAELVASDERRNVAVLRIYATATPFTLAAMTDESDIGTEAHAVYNAGGRTMDEAVGALSSISLADEIPGAGTGFLVLEFAAHVTADAAGGVLVDHYGRAIGLIAPQSQTTARNYAVPLYNIIGLIRSVPIAQTTTTPVLTPNLQPMPQVTVPQRPTSPLTPAGPGSAVLRETDPTKLLLASKTIYITSASNLFKPVQLLNELKKKEEFANWNLSLVGESEVADLILEIEHVPLTWEFNFSIRHQRTGIVIAAGKTYAWGGGDGASIMASRVVERLTKIRAGVKVESKDEE